MSRATHRRLKKLEAPLKGLPRLNFIMGPSDMSCATAMKILKLETVPGITTYYVGVLEPGERPVGGKYPLSDEEWELVKDYPKRDPDEL